MSVEWVGEPPERCPPLQVEGGLCAWAKTFELLGIEAYRSSHKGSGRSTVRRRPYSLLKLRFFNHDFVMGLGKISLVLPHFPASPS